MIVFYLGCIVAFVFYVGLQLAGPTPLTPLAPDAMNSVAKCAFAHAFALAHLFALYHV